MSKLKRITEDYNFPYNVREALSYRNWRNEFKHSKQRKARGWSDMDCWNAWHHIAKVTAEMLRSLDEKQNIMDWDEYFVSNYKSVGDYKSLSDVAQDIENYLNFDDTGWSESLDFEIKHSFKHSSDGVVELVSHNTAQEKKAIKRAIKEHMKEEKRLALRAEKAFIFVGKNLRGLWW